MENKKNVVFNDDCLKIMQTYPDQYFELAIVDPPYGINISNGGSYYNLKGKLPNNPHTKKDWDNSIPPPEYFVELKRISKNQIVWGGNYMTEYLPPSRCWIFWDKMKSVENYAAGELAWTSFDRNTKKVQILHNGFATKDRLLYGGASIHPTQKPIMLYEWLLMNFAEKGDKILDTHLGSGSSRIAAYRLGFEFVGIELDKEYYFKQEKRFNNFISQQILF
jgi:site-specific DNA-methyltransferase (adenine-specific)